MPREESASDVWGLGDGFPNLAERATDGPVCLQLPLLDVRMQCGRSTRDAGSHQSDFSNAFAFAVGAIRNENHINSSHYFEDHGVRSEKR